MPIYKMDGKKDGLQKYRVRINYTDSTGKSKQIDRVAYGKEEAKELERKLNLNLKEETTAKITLDELVDEYIKAKKNEVRETTTAKNKELLNRYVLPTLGKTRINKFTIKQMQDWKLYMEEQKNSSGEKLSLKYKQNVYGTFSALLNYAIKMEYIANNPLSKLGNFKDANLIKSEMDFYTAAEFNKFINVAYENAKNYEKTAGSIYEWNFYVFFMIAFYIGMRKGEINALKWSDIKNDTIYVTRSITQKLKGGDKETPPKNKSSIRTIQIPTPLKSALTEHYKRYSNLSGFTDDFRICGGEKCIRDTTLDLRNRDFSDKAGLKNIRIHDYRHSHASVLINAGINIKEIARRLGHSKVEQTWNTYSHLYPQEEQRALDVLNNLDKNVQKSCTEFTDNKKSA